MIRFLKAGCSPTACSGSALPRALWCFDVVGNSGLPFGKIDGAGQQPELALQQRRTTGDLGQARIARREIARQQGDAETGARRRRLGDLAVAAET
jgi:hypothetical protein